jgi:hypothetical protein
VKREERKWEERRRGERREKMGRHIFTSKLDNYISKMFLE